MEEHYGTRYDRIQIITVTDLLENRTDNYPNSTTETFKKAEETNRKYGTTQK